MAFSPEKRPFAESCVRASKFAVGGNWRIAIESCTGYTILKHCTALVHCAEQLVAYE